MAKREPTNRKLDRLASTRKAFPKRARPRPFWSRKTKGSPCQREEEGIIIWTLFDECYDS